MQAKSPGAQDPHPVCWAPRFNSSSFIPLGIQVKGLVTARGSETPMKAQSFGYRPGEGLQACISGKLLWDAGSLAQGPQFESLAVMEIAVEPRW